MTMSERQPTAFARAESSSRQVVLQVGLGVLSFVLGGILLSGLSARLVDRMPHLESVTAAWLLGWFLQRLWLVTTAPLFGYAIGRFTANPPVRYTLTACLSGEIFGVLLLATIDGFDVVFLSAADTLLRVGTLFFGMLLVKAAVDAGRGDAQADQAAADAQAQARKAEYDAFLAKAEGRDAPATAEAPPAAPKEPPAS